MLRLFTCAPSVFCSTLALFFLGLQFDDRTSNPKTSRHRCVGGTAPGCSPLESQRFSLALHAKRLLFVLSLLLTDQAALWPVPPPKTLVLTTFWSAHSDSSIARPRYRSRHAARIPGRTTRPAWCAGSGPIFASAWEESGGRQTSVLCLEGDENIQLNCTKSKIAHRTISSAFCSSQARAVSRIALNPKLLMNPHM